MHWPPTQPPPPPQEETWWVLPPTHYFWLFISKVIVLLLSSLSEFKELVVPIYLKSQLEFGWLIKLSIKKSSIFYVYIFDTNGAIHCKKEWNTTSLRGGEHSKFLGLVYGCNFFVCNSFRNPTNKNAFINILHDFWSKFCQILKNELLKFFSFFQECPTFVTCGHKF
jgi:hypothetical protein